MNLHDEYLLRGIQYQTYKGKKPVYHGSRQIDSISRRYYEKELGAGIGPSPALDEYFGYTEPFRRFIQREDFTPQANEIPNTMPSWLPGDDYYTNFHAGDPYVKVDEGYARLPGPGYAALHPELKDINPEDYPDIHKLRILADVAPYSREYNTYRQKIASELGDNTELRIEFEKILNRVRQTKESSIRMDNRRFTAPVEYPGRQFQFSSVGLSAADMSARVLGEHKLGPPVGIPYSPWSESATETACHELFISL